MISVRIRNYQSIEAADLEINGLTVLSGPNNSGKSALHRAIYGVFTNTRGNHFVRNGKDYCSVSLDFADGQTATWEKGAKVNRYRVNGKELNKVSHGVPDEVMSMGVNAVNIAGRDPLWPQFAHQFTGQVFLLDSPGSVLAEAIADVDRVGVLNEALRQAQSDHRSASSELKTRQADVVRLEAQEEKFLGLDDIETSFHALGRMESEVEANRKNLSSAQAIAERRGAVATLIQRLVPFRELESPSVDPRLPKLQAAYEWVVGAKSKIESARSTLKDQRTKSATINVVSLPTPPDVSSNLAALSDASGIHRRLSTLRQTQATLQSTHRQAEIGLQEADGSLADAMALLNTCPTCGSISVKAHTHS